MTQSQWVPLHCHSHYSLLDGLSKPYQIAGRLIECGYAAGAMTDHGNVSGAASYQKAMKESCKCGHEKKRHSSTRCMYQGCNCQSYEKHSLKPILGCEFYLCQQDALVREPTNRTLSHLCVLAKNAKGWRNLIRASSASNRPEFFYHKPRLDLERLAGYGEGEFIAFSGHVGSDLANVIFTDYRAAYASATYEEARSYVKDNWKEVTVALACKYRDLFGKDNFWIEIQVIDQDNCPAMKVIAYALRWVSKKTGIPCVGTADSHYCRREDSVDQRVLLCASLDTTLQEVATQAAAGEDVTLGAFFRSKRYHIPSIEELIPLHTPEELQASVNIAEMCENYDILGKPMLPEFPCPDGLTPDQYLSRLCEEGWKSKLDKRTKNGLIWGERGNTFGGDRSDPTSYTVEEYRNRLERELKVIFEAGLSGYFLIVQDYCAYARTKGKVGKGRGSAAGCLVSYLSGITDVDPLVYNLLFERFYNAGRNAPGRIAFPDIDSDFEKYKREDVINYVKGKFGINRVAQMATFTRMQGRGALKDVLRANSGASFEEMNRITEYIPDESAIADDLQEMMDETGESSIIRWALQNEVEGLKEWAYLTEDGSVEGPLAKHFAQAIRMEGTFRSVGKHPSGVVISPVDLQEIVPMFFDRASGEMSVAVDMRDAEAMGILKFDILGTTVLDKVRGATELIRTGRLSA
jgi:DNA polymerase-3 subunit alpha